MSEADDPVRSSATLGASRLIGIALELAVTSYLMRRLGPEPFGIMAMAASLTALLGAVGDAGVGASLVSDPRADAPRVGAAFVASVLLGGALALAVVASTPLVTAFYGTHEVAPVWVAMGLLVPLANLQSIPRSLAQRAEQFALLAWLPIAAGVGGSAAGIALAQSRLDYWPLVVRQGTTVILGSALLWLVVKPRLARPARGDLREVVRFGGGVLTFDLLNALNRNADKLLIGRYLGSESAGLYTLAYRVLSLPLTTLGSSVGTVAYPRLAKLSSDGAALSRELGLVMRSVAWIATPVCATAALAAPEVVLVLAGEGWDEAVLTFRILALLGLYQAPFAQVGMAYTVTRRTSLLARWGVVATPVLVGSFLLGLPWGISGVAISYAAASLLLAPGLLWYASTALGSKAWPLAWSGLRGILEGAVFAIPVLGVVLACRALDASPPVVVGASVVLGAGLEAWLVWRLRSLLRREP